MERDKGRKKNSSLCRVRDDSDCRFLRAKLYGTCNDTGKQVKINNTKFILKHIVKYVPTYSQSGLFFGGGVAW